jgi:hypothetical protein
MRETMYCGSCAAARGSAVVTTPAAPTAAGLSPTSGTTTSAFGWCCGLPLFRSSALWHLCALELSVLRLWTGYGGDFPRHKKTRFLVSYSQRIPSRCALNDNPLHRKMHASSPTPSFPCQAVPNGKRAESGGQSLRAQSLQRSELRNRGRPQHHPKAEVTEPVAGGSPVAEGAAGEVSIVVPRAAAHDPPHVISCVQILALPVERLVGYLKSGLKRSLPHRLRVHSHTLPLISSQP